MGWVTDELKEEIVYMENVPGVEIFTTNDLEVKIQRGVNQTASRSKVTQHSSSKAAALEWREAAQPLMRQAASATAMEAKLANLAEKKRKAEGSALPARKERKSIGGRGNQSESESKSES